MNKYLFKLTHISLLQFCMVFLQKLSFNNKQICTLLETFSTQNRRLPNYEQAIQYLDKLNPDSQNSAIKACTLEDNNYHYDLKIIVAAYNAASTIEECISSILNQKTKYSLLVEIIDDGSTDKTKQLLKKYTNNDNIIVTSQKNQGFSGARNTGLKIINAKYLCFVDSDDLLEDCFAETLLDKAFAEQADIVAGGYQQFNHSGVISEFDYQNKNEFNPYELYGYPWGKIYRVDLFNKIDFPEDYWFEDTILIYLIYGQSQTTCTVADLVYRYRSNQNGITAIAATKPKAIDSLWVTRQLLFDRKKLGLDFNEEIYKVTLQQICTNFIRCRFLGGQVQRAVFVVQQQLINDYFENSELKEDGYLKMIEKAIKSNNYLAFTVYAYSTAA
ncbi:glycosyltransferase family A protein [Lactobacillus sp. UCMA15818]|uniref:glycosyltransferase family 2 protein n=1 Tax=Lactobacillus sp. UCMA15818 TaxID=2583394 RepID=UPI0025B1602C|nr:glycosyltransferase family A protein [Lactobacillus sp. UCMA15818]MDN2453675.1 glycosyltransferase family 2 protein [Lactobacillus sp. UCMA15818]